MSTRPSWIALQGASKCWDGQALPMQQKNRMHHVDPLLLGSWMIHVYSYPYQLNQGVIKFLQLLKLHHRELLRSMACHLPLFPSFQGVPLTKCGVNAGDQQNVKSLQGATVAALAASTAAKKNKERVIMALLRCSGGKLGIIFEKTQLCWPASLTSHCFCCDTYLTARYPTSDSDCFAVFDPSELRAKAGLGHIRLFLLSHHKLRYMLQLPWLFHRYTDILSRTTILEKIFWKNILYILRYPPWNKHSTWSVGYAMEAVVSGLMWRQASKSRTS